MGHDAFFKELLRAFFAENRPLVPPHIREARPPTTIDRPLHREEVLGEEVCGFRFWRIGLPKLPGAEYVRRRNALAPGLAALMTPGTPSRAEWKRECLRAIARTRVDRARRRLLVDCVEGYLPLTPGQQVEFERITRWPEDREIRRMKKLWSEQMMDLGEKRGEKRGEMRAKRETLLAHMRARFGRLPIAITRKVVRIGEPRRFDVLLKRVVTVQTLDDMVL